MAIVPIRASVLAPFNYGHLAVQGGVATIPEIVSDTAIAFGLCAAMGMLHTCLRPPEENYRLHISRMPWRTSMLTCNRPRLLPPLARRSDLGVEGGYPSKVQRAAKSGNFKEFFTIQEVPCEQVFQGAVFGLDPFLEAGEDRIVVRIGSNRTGILLIEKDEDSREVRLNAATGALFSRSVPVARYLTHRLQMSPPMSLDAAARETAEWN